MTAVIRYLIGSTLYVMVRPSLRISHLPRRPLVPPSHLPLLQHLLTFAREEDNYLESLYRPQKAIKDLRPDHP